MLTVKAQDHVRITHKTGQAINIYLTRVKGKYEVRLGFEGHKDLQIALVKGEPKP